MQVKVRKTYASEPKPPTKWRGQVEVNTNEGQWLFTIECSVIEGREGDFVGFPSRKTPDGDYFNMVRGSNDFQGAIVRAVNEYIANPPDTSSGGDEYARTESAF